MIQQLVNRLITQNNVDSRVAALSVLRMDPLDLALEMEKVWERTVTFGPPLTIPAGTNAPPAPAARATLLSTGAYNGVPMLPGGEPAWDHLGYAYVLENTRAVQILRRVVREYRAGEGLGIPSLETQQWLNTTEALLFGAAYPFPAWLSTSSLRQDPEAIRRNAYWRFFGLDLAFGTDDNRPPQYDKASATNHNFAALFEELLFELWQAMSNVRNTSGANAADNDRIYRLTEALNYELLSRRQNRSLAREELAATTALGWIDLSLDGNSPVVVDLRAHATSSSDRLKLIGERVGLAPHSRSASLFAMAKDLSAFLRTIESGIVSGPQFAWMLYLTVRPTPVPAGTPAAFQPIGNATRRVITEWAAATGKDLKQRPRPAEVRPAARQLVAVR
jgi:hypothetical protein